jgi:hypothetical protein
MSNNLKNPIPDRVVVSGPALVQLINALNGPQHHILELLVTRKVDRLNISDDPRYRNPINVLEDELLAYQRGETAHNVNIQNPSQWAADDFSNCVLENYNRVPEIGR